MKQRDREFNEVFGIDINHGWLAVSKDVPENAHVVEGWELADAQKSELVPTYGLLDIDGWWAASRRIKHQRHREPRSALRMAPGGLAGTCRGCN